MEQNLDFLLEPLIHVTMGVIVIPPNVYSCREQKEQAIANSIVNSSILSKSYVAISLTVSLR